MAAQDDHKYTKGDDEADTGTALRPQDMIGCR